MPSDDTDGFVCKWKWNGCYQHRALAHGAVLMLQRHRHATQCMSVIVVAFILRLLRLYILSGCKYTVVWATVMCVGLFLCLTHCTNEDAPWQTWCRLHRCGRVGGPDTNPLRCPHNTLTAVADAFLITLYLTKTEKEESHLRAWSF